MEQICKVENICNNPSLFMCVKQQYLKNLLIKYWKSP